MKYLATCVLSDRFYLFIFSPRVHCCRKKSGSPWIDSEVAEGFWSLLDLERIIG